MGWSETFFFLFLRCMSRDKVREEEKGARGILNRRRIVAANGAARDIGGSAAKFPSPAV
jgi:hypothetical protein